MGNISISCIRVGMLQTNCYVIYDEDVKEAVVVDPGDGADFIASCLEDMELKPVAILLTHAHMDHIQAVPELKKAWKVPLYVHKDDVPMLENGELNLGRLSVKTEADDVILSGDEKLSLGQMDIKVIHTPGHTPGGVCYYFEKDKILISGDTMFYCSWGRTDFPGGSERDLMDSIREKLLPLPEDVKVYPGHEGATTIGNERRMHGFIG